MVLHDLLTPEVLDSYSKACADIGVELWTLAQSERFGHLLMPSRGAFPFLDGAQASMYWSGNDGERPESHVVNKLKEIWLPFTAPDSEKLSSAQMRKYWCLVLKGILTNQQSADYSIYRYLTCDVFNQRFDFAVSDANRPSGLVIIDTVVSGRAVAEISCALDDVGIHNFIMLLAVDKNGASLRPEYEYVIKQLETQGRAKRFYVQSIFTEDSNPGLTGVSSVVFPQLSERLSDITESPVTVGFWHLEVAARPNKLNLPYTRTRAIIGSAINRTVMKFVNKGCHSAEEFINKRERSNLKVLHEIDAVSNPDLARAFIQPVLQKGLRTKGENLKIDVSSSFIMSVTLKDELLTKIVRSLRSEMLHQRVK